MKLRNSFAAFVVAFLALTLTACGGGETEMTTKANPFAAVAQVGPAALAKAKEKSSPLASNKAPLASLASPDVWGGVGRTEAVRQLFELAEKATSEGGYSHYFPTHETTASHLMFDYRCYPTTTRLCLGVVKESGWNGFNEGDTYWTTIDDPVGSLTYVAPLTSIFTPKLQYTMYIDRKVALWTEGFPFLTEKTSSGYMVTRFNNDTGKTLGSCGAADKPLPDGVVLFECTTIGSPSFERLIYTGDVQVGKLVGVFTGIVPSDITFTVVEETSTQPVAGTTSAHADNGWYYADPNNFLRLLFQADAGGEPAIVKEGNFATDGTIKVIRSYSK